MGTYRMVWNGMVTLLVVVAAALGGFRVGWLPMLGALVGMAVVGAIFSLAWVADGGRLRLMVQCGGWFAIVSLLVLGLPELIGPWTLLVLMAVGLSAPFLMGWLVQAARDRAGLRAGRSPEQSSADDLVRRWRWTTAQLADRSLPASAVLMLVQERASILDEMERRSPQVLGRYLGEVPWRQLER